MAERFEYFVRFNMFNVESGLYHLRHLVDRANPFSDRIAIARLKCRFGSAPPPPPLVVSTGSPLANRLVRSTTHDPNRFDMPSGRPPVVRITPTTESTWERGAKLRISLLKEKKEKEFPIPSIRSPRRCTSAALPAEYSQLRAALAQSVRDSDVARGRASDTGWTPGRDRRRGRFRRA